MEEKRIQEQSILRFVVLSLCLIHSEIEIFDVPDIFYEQTRFKLTDAMAVKICKY